MDDVTQSQSPPTSLGRNRLVSGFGGSTTRSRSYSGDSVQDAIQISDEDGEVGDSEGGMVINVEGQQSIAISDDDENAQEMDMGVKPNDASITSPAPLEESTHQATEHSLMAQSRLRLSDLNSQELEEQLKYAFFHLDRSQVDLSRPVICLACLNEGHKAQDCREMQCQLCEDDYSHPTRACPTNQKCDRCRQRGHNVPNCPSEMKITTSPLCDLCDSFNHAEYQCPQRFFPTPQAAGPFKLWISCCYCASKTHLIGDCPDADSTAARWSLKELDPGQITNMSLESGTRKLEKEVENRGVRPPGLQIKGRAGLHHAAAKSTRPSSDDDSNDSFLRPPVRRLRDDIRPQLRLGKYEALPSGPSPLRGQQDGYDRYEAPNREPRNRAPNNWYATDSFGQSRSRSPALDNVGSTYRPGESKRRRSPSARRFDGNPQRNPFDSRAQSPPRDRWRPSQRADTAHLPQRSLQGRIQSSQQQNDQRKPSHAVQLPSRKGSNPNLPSKPPPPTAQSSSSGAGEGGSQSSKARKKPKRRKGPAGNS